MCVCVCALWMSVLKSSSYLQRLVFLNSCLTVYYRLHAHTHLLFLLDNIHTESHTERASESSWKRFVRSPSWNWETETLLHYCYSQLKHCVNVSVCACVFVFMGVWGHRHDWLARKLPPPIRWQKVCECVCVCKNIVGLIQFTLMQFQIQMSLKQQQE